jgi:hypothetical protein
LQSSIQREKKDMCDYSLMNIPNRLAREGEELVAHRFGSGSMGLASNADLHPSLDPPAPSTRRFWSAVRQFLNPPVATTVPAVCIPPGARLVLKDIPTQIQRDLAVGAVEEVAFTQLTAASHSYRDAMRFRNGKELLLQRLREGQRVKVLTLGLGDGANTLPEERLSQVLG